MERIDAGLLIPGRGEPVRDATVLIDGNRVSYAGPAAGAPQTPEVVSRSTATVLPGLWDCHGHFMGSRAMDLAGLATEPVQLRAARSARDLTNALNAGVTSVREVGGLGIYLARAVREGLLDGPSVYAAGAVLSTTGGHGDLHCYPLSWMADLCGRPGRVTLGMTPLQAIEAATATAPLTLGPQAPKSGLLVAGYDADLITLDGDPLADISIMASPARVTGVWVGGRQVKG